MIKIYEPTSSRFVCYFNYNIYSYELKLSISFCSNAYNTHFPFNIHIFSHNFINKSSGNIFITFSILNYKKTYDNDKIILKLNN